MKVDYEELLKKYMKHVADWEGTTFVSSTDLHDFTSDELFILRQIDKEV